MQSSRTLSVPSHQNTFRSPLGSPSHSHAPLPNPAAASGPPPLNLKVMRLSRPSLSHASPPFLSAPSTSPTAAPSDSLTQALRTHLSRSLESTPEDPTFPLSSLLALPGSFGTISLGETFTSSLALSNDTALPVSYVRLRVELQAQTSGSRSILCDIKPIGEQGRIEAGGVLSEIVVCEIKELGMHSLVCEATWGLGEEERSFRKVYKFQTLNPLSVKTKVHLPNGPSSSLSPTLRNLVYLELHLQNTSPLPLQFSRMAFEPISGLTYKTLHDDLRDDKSADGAQIDPNDVARVGGVMNPGDIRQVCFIVDETGREGGIVDGIKTIWEPGTVLPLGRMDITWTSAYGEPGRLQTSILNRRIPAPHLQSTTISSNPLKTPLPMASPGLSRSDSLPTSSTNNSAQARRPLVPSLLHSQHQSSTMQGTQSLPPTPPPKQGLERTNSAVSNEGTTQELAQSLLHADDWSVDLVVVSKPQRMVTEEKFEVELEMRVRRRSAMVTCEEKQIVSRTRRRWLELRHRRVKEEGVLCTTGRNVHRIDLEEEDVLVEHTGEGDETGEESEPKQDKPIVPLPTPKTTTRSISASYFAVESGLSTLAGASVWLLVEDSADIASEVEDSPVEISRLMASRTKGVKRSVLLREWPSLGAVVISRS